MQKISQVEVWWQSNTDILKQLLQVLMPGALDEHVFVVDIFDDNVVGMFSIDLDDDGFDGGIAFHEYA